MDNKFSSSINDIDERVFEKYYAFERKLDIKRAHKAKMKAKFFAAAACLTIFACIGVTVILPAMRKDNPDDPLSIPNDTAAETEHSFFTDTVHSSGENVEDDTNESAMETAEETVVETVTEAEVVTDADTTENDVTGEIETEDTAPYEIRVDDNMVFIKDENGCYVVIDDLYKYQTSLGGMQLAYIPFDSIEDFYNTVNSGVLDNSQKELIAWAVRVYSNNRTCDLKNLYEPILPQGCDVLSVGWYVSYYSFSIKKSDEFRGYIQILNEEGYNQLYVRDFENIIGENDTVTHVENIDGIETIYYYRSSRSYKNVRYTLQSGNKTVIVDKKFDMGTSEIVPSNIKLYCVENGNYYVVNLNQIYEDLSDELLREFGLKRYVKYETDISSDFLEFVTPEFVFDENVEIQIEIKEISANKAVITLYNNTDEQIFWNYNHYTIEKLENNSWVEVKHGNVTQYEETCTAYPHKSRDVEYSLKEFEFNSEGLYRIRLSYNNKYICATFQAKVIF